MLLETIYARKPACGEELAIDAQIREALVIGPLGEIRVDAFAIDDQRCQQADVPAAVVAHDARRNGVCSLRLDWHLALGTMLRAELDEQQAQEMMDFGQRADRALAPAAASPLLDRHGRRNAVNR